VTALRAAAAQIVDVPQDLPPIAEMDVTPAGSMGRPALEITELDPQAWRVLLWRQDRP
jgi:hypothetical protein